MFETTVVESRRTKVGIEKYLTLPVSIGMHVVVILAVIVGTIWSVSFPTNSPAVVAQYALAVSPFLPPPCSPRRSPRSGAAGRQDGGGAQEHP